MTKKYVLTGGPCSGKTTAVFELRKRGYDVLHEVAREVIEGRLHMPFTPEENFLRQKLIIDRQVEKENLLEGDEVYLDRGFIDCFAYQKYFFGRVFPELLEKSKEVARYDQVFVFDRLPFENDGLRIENGDEEAQRIHHEIINQYRLHGYDPVFVPVMPVEERVDFMIKHIRRKNGMH